MDKEKIINDYMKKLGISREEAEQLYEDDLEDFIGEEGEAMTEKAKAIKIRGDGEEKKKKSTKERKVDEAKKEYEKVDAEIKAKVGEREKVITGEYVIERKSFTKKAFTVPESVQYRLMIKRL